VICFGFHFVNQELKTACYNTNLLSLVNELEANGPTEYTSPKLHAEAASFVPVFDMAPMVKKAGLPYLRFLETEVIPLEVSHRFSTKNLRYVYASHSVQRS
jgi:hypothetical protein